MKELIFLWDETDHEKIKRISIMYSYFVWAQIMKERGWFLTPSNMVKEASVIR